MPSGIDVFHIHGFASGHHKPVIQDYMPLLSRVEKRLMGIASFASYSGWLTLVNSVLSALPTYYIFVLHLPLEIIDQINKYHRHCFW
jgi:hypothetical protein